MSDAVLEARAAVLHDLDATGVADAAVVSLLEDAVSERRWWASQWEQGLPYVAGLIAQDVQDALLDRVGRWPLCTACDQEEPHALYIHPELGGPEPTWVCEVAGIEVAALGQLGRDR